MKLYYKSSKPQSESQQPTAATYSTLTLTALSRAAKSGLYAH